FGRRVTWYPAPGAAGPRAAKDRQRGGGAVEWWIASANEPWVEAEDDGEHVVGEPLRQRTERIRARRRLYCAHRILIEGEIARSRDQRETADAPVAADEEGDLRAQRPTARR